MPCPQGDEGITLQYANLPVDHIISNHYNDLPRDCFELQLSSFAWSAGRPCGDHSACDMTFWEGV